MHTLKLMIIIPVVALTIVGCATLPPVHGGSPNYLASGMVKDGLKGHSFYAAIGDVNLYRARTFGGYAPTGATAESPVALQVNPETGLVVRAVTLQPYTERTTTAAGGLFAPSAVITINKTAYRVDDLLGGVSIIDIHPYATWLDAIKAMQAAAKTLGSSGNFASPNNAGTSVVVTRPAIFSWWFLGPPRPSFFYHRRFPRR